MLVSSVTLRRLLTFLDFSVLVCKMGTMMTDALAHGAPKSKDTNEGHRVLPIPLKCVGSGLMEWSEEN